MNLFKSLKTTSDDESIELSYFKIISLEFDS